MALDTSYLYFRAYFGLPRSFASPQGFPVNAVRGTCDFITRLVGQYSPEHVVCAWDEQWRPAWRVELLPSYKAHRANEDGAESVEPDLIRQVPWIRHSLEAVGLPVIGVPDHEADDVLASLVRQHDDRSLVVTGDRDLYQLIDGDTSVVYVGRSVSKAELITPESFRRRHGFDPQRHVDFAVLRGDPSDGLPGVAGIGDKTAAILVGQYESLTAMVEAAQDPASDMKPVMRQKLLAAREYLHNARRVVTTVDTLSLPMRQRRDVDREAVQELTERLGLGSSLERLANALA